jgi:hypothetical protein
MSESIRAGVMRQRAASCTSTQSWRVAPTRVSSYRPLATLAARVAPPQGTTSADVGLRSKKPSPGATTTTVLAMRLTAANAASVCHTIGWPAMRSYCLGPGVPARLPVPAHGTRA